MWWDYLVSIPITIPTTYPYVHNNTRSDDTAMHCRARQAGERWGLVGVSRARQHSVSWVVLVCRLGCGVGPGRCSSRVGSAQYYYWATGTTGHYGWGVRTSRQVALPESNDVGVCQEAVVEHLPPGVAVNLLCVWEVWQEAGVELLAVGIAQRVVLSIAVASEDGGHNEAWEEKHGMQLAPLDASVLAVHPLHRCTGAKQLTTRRQI